MKNKSCCFTGHRDIASGKIPIVKEKLVAAINDAVSRGYTDFYNGGALGFDIMAAEAVLEIKKTNPLIRLHIIVPCENQALKWGKKEIERYEAVKAAADEVKVLSPHYFRGCMQIRNRYMVDASSICIAFVERSSGGSADTVKYARQKGTEVVII